MNICLKYINESLSIERPDIIIFQKNLAVSCEESAVAWKVIKDCGNYNYHPFDFPLELYVNVSDCWGNYTPLQPVKTSGFFKLLPKQYGRILCPLNNPHTSSGQILVENGMQKGTVAANIFRGNRLLATQPGIAPGHTASFTLNRTIFMATHSRRKGLRINDSGIKEGEVLKARVSEGFKQEIPLDGITAADIIMKGGGPGPEATAYRFLMDNRRR